MPMKPTKRRVAPVVDAMEPRTLLSTGATLLSSHALRGVVHRVHVIVANLVRSGDTDRASAALANLAARIPSGTEQLAPAWRADLARYQPANPGSGMATQRRLLRGLNHFVRGHASGGGVGPPAPGPRSTGQPPSSAGTGASTASGTAGNSGSVTPAAHLDSVTIANTTGLNLLVTVYLRVPQVQQPWITTTIPAGSPIVAFDFGSATGSFMTMTVSMADGSQSPPPLANVALDQPIAGYRGTLFTISLFGPYFNVTPS